MGVFGGLLANHVDHVVVGDDPQHVVFVVDHGNGQQIVMRHLGGHVFLIVGHVDRHQIAFHEFDDLRFGLPHGGDQLPGGDEPSQMILLVDHIEIVDGFELSGLLADRFQRLADGHGFAEPGELGGHDGPGRILGIGAKPLDVATFLGRNQRHQLVDDPGPHFGQQVDPIVGRHFADERGDLWPIERLDDLDLSLLLEEAEDLDPKRHFGVLQHVPGFLGREPFHELGRSGGVQLGTELGQGGRVVLGQHLA